MSAWSRRIHRASPIQLTPLRPMQSETHAREPHDHRRRPARDAWSPPTSARCTRSSSTSAERHRIHAATAAASRSAPARHGDAVNIYVEDNGIGIPEDALHKLARPFEQVEIELEDYEGSGLGLAIARSLTELHGGGLRIRSRKASAPSCWSTCR